ncbi:MAG: radical SAM protein [Deltaproteobacteria bacterium]|nr:radical SAM protein [Deltaproteobacteria bacterium]
MIVSEHPGRWNRRFVVRLSDGALVESVLYRGDTLCVSCQVGCAVRCPFCASGANGLGRSLSLDELEAQVEEIASVVARERGPALRGVTVSGIGEPLHNHDAVSAFVDRCRARGLRVTLTTSGGPLRRLREWLRERPHQGLTISVHAGAEATRARAVPHGPDLASLFAVLGEELPALGRARRKRTALAYLLLDGVNDSDAEIDAFVARAAPLGAPRGVMVHLYAHNPVETSAMRGVDRARYEAVYARMVAAGLTVRMSAQARIEANGGCGTLVALRR